MRKSRFLGLVAALLLTAALTVGAQEVTVTGYLLGGGPAGTQDVVDALNVKLKKDLGIRLQLNYIGWNEVNSKYPLVLAAGENVDWVFAANWNNYSTLAVKGAFKELTPEMLKKNMPRHWAATPPEAWDQVKVDGKIYLIPTATPDRKTPVAVIRGDLRKKYGLSPVTSVKDLDAYLAAVKKNNPDMIPINLGSGYDIGQPFNAVLAGLIPPSQPIAGTLYYAYEDKGHGVLNQLEEPYLSAYKKTAAVLKAWYDKGYINKSPFQNTVLSKASFAQGKSAVGFGNGIDIQEVLGKAKDQGFDPEIIPILSSTGHSNADGHAGNGVAIAANTKNWEKTLQFLDLIMEDKAYNHLVYFGIEGKNYAITADGKLGLPPGVTPEKNSYPPDAAGFWFVNKDLFPPLVSWTPSYIAYKESLKTLLVTNTFIDFSFNPESVKSQVAAVTNVLSQYQDPIYVGAVPDVNKAVDNLVAKLKTAGQPKLLAEVRAQVKAFYK